VKSPSIVLMLISGVVGSLVAGCGDKAETPPQPVRIVKAMTVGTTTGNHSHSFGGDVRARNETLGGFRVGGKIAERLVDVGATVKAGQPLARLDVADLALRASEANAQLAQADADAKRYRDLRAKNFVSQSALDARDTALKAASAQAALARNQSSYAILTADRAGVVAEVLAQPGQVVTAGQAVFRLAWDGEREAAISIPEDAVADIKVGSAAEISLWSMPGKTWRGRVREVAPIADATTRTYAVRVSILDNTVDNTTPPLGMSATVNFKTSGKSTLLVPMTSIFQQGDKPAVWVIDKNGKLALRPVRISAYTDNGARIADGLAVGERIVTAGVNRLHADEKVSATDGTH
jgi:membrane fusion protein, multidrug efflux system